MRKRYLTNGRLVWALLSIALALCLAISSGLYLRGSAAMADEGDVPIYENSWVEEPHFVHVTSGTNHDDEVEYTHVDGWEQGVFDGSYTVRAEAEYGNDELYFKIYQEREGGLENIEFSQGVSVQGVNDTYSFRTDKSDKDGLLPAYVINKLKTLPAGEYYLIAIVPEGAKEGNGGVEYEYDGINYGVALIDSYVRNNGVRFTITDEAGVPAEIELSIEEWNYGGYSQLANVISINLGANLIPEVSYSVYNDNNGRKGTLRSNLSAFKTNANGVVQGDDVISAFARLNAGNYWLYAEITVNGTTISKEIPFEVHKSDKGWEVLPSALSWTWGEFNASVHKISGKLADSARVLTYSIYNVIGVPLEGVGQFVVASDGTIPANVATVIAGLDAGSYYIRCQASSANYIDIDEYIPITINPVQNMWEDIPSVIGWSEGSFDSTVNALQGTAKMGNVKFSIVDSKDNVLYTVTKEDNGLLTVLNADGESVNINWLNKLSVGTYQLVAEVEGTVNYTALKNSIHFVIADDAVALSGIIAVTVVFAVIDLGAAVACIILLIKRRRKVEEQFKQMVSKELHGR